jgi:hypothetical protein
MHSFEIYFVNGMNRLAEKVEMRDLTDDWASTVSQMRGT